LELLRTEVQGTAIHQSVALIIGDPNQLRHITQIASRRDHQLQSKHDLVAGEDQPFAYSLNSLFDLAATRVSTGELISLRDHFRGSCGHRPILKPEVVRRFFKDLHRLPKAETSLS
jgi:hypothetical protein